MIRFARTKLLKIEFVDLHMNSREHKSLLTLQQKKLENFSMLVIATRNRLKKESDCRSIVGKKRKESECKISLPNRSA